MSPVPASLDLAVNNLIEVEGGYSNHPDDKGGETNWGITEAVARAYGYQGPMIDLPRAQAWTIYVERYWYQPRFNLVHLLSALIAEELLDTGVNMGVAKASSFMQRALNVLNAQGRTFPDLEVDGSVGKMTLECLRRYLRARGKIGEKVLFNMMNAQQSVRYMELAESRTSQEKFEFGWQAQRVVFQDHADPELASNSEPG